MNNTNPTEIDTSFIAYAADAAQSLNTFLDSQGQATENEGFILLAYRENGDKPGLSINGHRQHLINAICNSVVDDKTKITFVNDLLIEIERRLTSRLKYLLEKQ